MINRRSIEQVLGRLGDLPAIPEVVAEVLLKTSNPNVALSDVSEVIQRDPALTAKLLKVSNSPYYGMRQVVGTLKLALVILGLREVRNIVLGVSVLESLKNNDTQALLKRPDYWGHSVLVGGLARRLGLHLRLGLQGEDFVSGLLHDIGKLVMWRQLKRDYERVYLASGGHGPVLCAAETEAFGFDHADAAAVLATKWNMPETLVDALWRHHPREDRPLTGAKDPKLAAIVRIANQASQEQWDQGTPDDHPSCADEEAWATLLDRPESMPLPERVELFASFGSNPQESHATTF